MQLKTAFLSFALLVCPCALCYGQLSFLGVNGERGYSAMRSVYVWDLDNNLVFTPSYEFYRQSDDSEVEKTGSVHRYGLKSAYDLSDNWNVYTRVFVQPKAVGNEGLSYYTGMVWFPFYRYGLLKNPFIDIRLGQARYRTQINTEGNSLEDRYKQVDTNLQVATGAELGPWNLKASWHKVIQYNNRIRKDVSFNWADIPFMTAVVQGFLREAAAVRVSFPTYLLTPYASAVRYEYAETGRPALAVNAGLQLKWDETTFAGGIEVFEPRREENRKTFFSMSVEIDF